MEKLIYLKHIKNRSCVLEPSDVEPMNEAIEALEQADLIVLGPGSLYTSVISNLCVKGISEALLRTSAPKLYVSNVMTQPGETDNYDVKEHIDALTDKLVNHLLILSYVAQNPIVKMFYNDMKKRIRNQ